MADILAAAAILAGMAVIGRSVAWLISVLRKLARLVDALTGEPPGPGEEKGRPGVLDRLASIEGGQIKTAEVVAALEARLAAVEAQLQPNGGGTLRDALDRTEAAVTAKPEQQETR